MILKRARRKIDFVIIKKLYIDSFPANERAPFYMLKRRAKQGKADLWCIYDEKLFVGMAYVVSYNNLSYLFYFAIEKSLRGMHYGTRALKTIFRLYEKNKIFLALEDWKEEADNKEERLKRHDFYLRAGLKDIPYYLKEVNMIYMLMGRSDLVYPKEYKALIDNYLGFPKKYLLDMRIIKSKDRIKKTSGIKNGEKVWD